MKTYDGLKIQVVHFATQDVICSSAIYSKWYWGEENFENGNDFE